MRRLICFLVFLGLVVSMASASFGQAVEKEGFIADKFLSMPVKFVDNEGDGKVEVLKEAMTGDTVYTFATPIDMPQSGDAVEISGEISFYGATMPVPFALVLVF